MSKEANTPKQHELSSVAVQMAKNISNIDCLQKGGEPSDHWGRVLLDELGRLTEEISALSENFRLKEAECEALASDVCLIVSAASDALLSGSEQQHVNHLYRVIHDVSGKLYTDDMGGGNENQQAD